MPALGVGCWMDGHQAHPFVFPSAPEADEAASSFSLASWGRWGRRGGHTMGSGWCVGGLGGLELS